MQASTLELQDTSERTQFENHVLPVPTNLFELIGLGHVSAAQCTQIQAM